jgi:hypothetical protein
VLPTANSPRRHVDVTTARDVDPTWGSRFILRAQLLDRITLIAFYLLCMADSKGGRLCDGLYVYVYFPNAPFSGLVPHRP